MQPAVTESSIHRDVQALSLQLLLVAREVARASPAEAHLRFGLEKGEVDMLREADVEGLRTLSNQGTLTFRPLFSRLDLMAMGR